MSIFYKGKRGRRAIVTTGIAAGITNENWVKDCKTVEDYAKWKLDILEKDFKIELTSEEISELMTCNTRDEVDIHSRHIINRHWR